MKTNIDVVRCMSAEQLAAFMYLSCRHLLGWTFIDLIDWLNASDNISDKVNDDLVWELLDRSYL